MREGKKIFKNISTPKSIFIINFLIIDESLNNKHSSYLSV